MPPEAASSWLLPERMGWQSAAAVLLASEWIDADQAVDVRPGPPGLPGRDGASRRRMALARRIAAFPAHATREIKRLMMARPPAGVVAARHREEAAFAALFADPPSTRGRG